MDDVPGQATFGGDRPKLRRHTSYRYAKPAKRQSWVAVADLVLTSALQFSSV